MSCVLLTDLSLRKSAILMFSLSKETPPKVPFFARDSAINCYGSRGGNQVNNYGDYKTCSGCLLTHSTLSNRDTTSDNFSRLFVQCCVQ